MRLSMPLAACAMALALATGSTASAAPRQTPPDNSTVQLRATFPAGQCLDSNADAATYTTGCDANNRYQQWTWIQRGGNNVMLTDVATGRCLDSNAAGGAYTSPCGVDNQYEQWTYQEGHNISGGGTGTYWFTDVATGRCLYSNINGDAFTSTACYPDMPGIWNIDAVS